MAFLVPLTIGWKIAAHSVAPDDLVGRISSFLTKNDFIVDPPEQILNVGASESEASIIHATNSACKLSVAQLAIDGSNRELVDAKLGGTERRFIVFGGSIYSQRPDFAILRSYFVSRVLKELGISHRGLPVVAVASNASCNAEELPWSEL